MIQLLANKFQKRISSLLFLLFYCEMIVSAAAINNNKNESSRYFKYGEAKNLAESGGNCFIVDGRAYGGIGRHATLRW